MESILLDIQSMFRCFTTGILTATFIFLEPPPPPPKPPSPPPMVQTATQTRVIETRKEDVEPLPPEPKHVIDYTSLERVATELYLQNKDVFLTYHNVPWTLHVRKEVSLVMRIPVFALCEQQRRRSACASMQSDQHLCCSLPG